MLHVRLDSRVVKLAANQALGVEHSVVWIHRNLQKNVIKRETIGFWEKKFFGEKFCSDATFVLSNHLILGSISNKTFSVCEGDIRRRGTVSLI